MPRSGQWRAARGSQKWLQQAIKQDSLSLIMPIAERLGVAADTICWLSPLPHDDFAEYYDAAFLERLGVELPNRALAEFWPTRGPHWDGLGKTERGDLLLVEAKAHIAEMISSPSSAKAQRSVERIKGSLAETKRHLRVPEDVDWARTYYQYTNRLAHLYLLRELNGLPAWLVFVHFVGDADMAGPNTAAPWEEAMADMRTALKLPRDHALSPYVIDVFVNSGTSKT
jgi:hypothetical protein